MKVLNERKAQSINDVASKEVPPITSTAPKYERGKQKLKKPTSKPETFSLLV